ncbi:MAG: hypothetical protein LBU17_01585, partial [Treponema sp.]|nr:hypothetical protein [Treponema sp.]
MSAENIYFDIEADGDVLLGLRFPDDPYNMNWIEGTVPWGTVKVPDAISISVKREYTPQNSLRETYCFTNKSNFPFFTQIGDIGIYTPFNDSYHEAKFCLHNRCHAHIWCGGTSSHVMALRMGGEAPHLGLVLTKGSLAHYSVERDISLLCNDRGDFIIHPSAMELLPGESAVVEWELFRHKGKED